MQVVISPYLMAAVPYKRANRYKYQLKREAQKNAKPLLSPVHTPLVKKMRQVAAARGQRT